MPFVICGGAEPRLLAKGFDFFFRDPGICRFFVSSRPEQYTLGTQLDFGDRMDFPDHGHAALQAWRPRRLPGVVRRVEKQRAIDLHRNGRLIEMVTGTGQIGRAKEVLVGGSSRV
jgi:hypothetical protein